MRGMGLTVFVAAAAVAWKATGFAVAGPEAPGDTAWLQAALASASPGAVIDVPPGVYEGPFVVDRTVHLRGDGRAELRGDGTTHVVSVTAPDVTIEGFRITHSGMNLRFDHAAIHVTGARPVIRGNHIAESLHGIYVRGASGARIEDNRIHGMQTRLDVVDPDTLRPAPTGGELCEVSLDQNQRGNGIHIWNSAGHVIERNVIRDTRDGIYFSFVVRSEIRDNDIEGARYGLHYMYSDENTFTGNAFRRSAAGAALMFSKRLTLRDNRFESNRNQRAYGLLLQTVDASEISHNVMTGNTMGLFIEGGSGNRVVGNTIADNHVGMRVSDSSDNNTFTGNRFTGNLHTVETDGLNRFNRWSENGRGNYWDGAWRLDLDRDGIADVPHRELDLFGRLRREVPQIGLLIGSPGERLLRFVHARAAVSRLPGIVDHSPLVDQTEGPREAAR